MKFFFRNCLFVLLLVFFSSTVSADNASDVQYLSMLKDLKEANGEYDYKVLRDAYTKTSFYKPYSTMPKLDITKLMDESSKNLPKAQEAFDEYVDKNFIYFDTHIRAMVANDNSELKNDMALSKVAGGKILSELMRSGDGTSYETAYIVLSVAEEYVILRGMEKMQGLVKGNKSLENHNNHVYDVWDVTLERRPEVTKLYFDVTTPFANMKLLDKK